MKKFSTLLVSALAASQALSGEIIQIDSLRQIAPYLKEANGDTLMVFDIDETLIVPDDPAMQRANFSPHKETIKKVKESLDPSRKRLFLNVTLLFSDGVLIEETTPALLQEWHKQGIKMVALSSAMSGKIDGVDMLEKRLRNFQKLGLQFASFPKKEITFTNLNPYFGATARFKEGILHANTSDQIKGVTDVKGPVVLEFLQSVSCTPKTLICVDDNRELLEEIEKTVKTAHPTMNIRSFHYEGAKNYPAKPITSEQIRNRWQEMIDKTNILHIP